MNPLSGSYTFSYHDPLSQTPVGIVLSPRAIETEDTNNLSFDYNFSVKSKN